MPSTSEVRGVERIGQVLACFTRETPDLSLAEFDRKLKWSKATIHRYLSALHRMGLLAYDEDRRVYSVGSEIVRLASILVHSVDLSDAAAPSMRRLTQDVGLTSTLTVWLDSRPVVVRCESNTSRLGRWEIPVGSLLPPTSAVGEIFAAFGDSPRQLSDVGESHLAEVRAAGVAFRTDLSDGVTAAGVPILDSARVVAALSLVGPRDAMPADSDDLRIQRLREAAAEISAMIGGAKVVAAEEAAPAK